MRLVTGFNTFVGRFAGQLEGDAGLHLRRRASRCARRSPPSKAEIALPKRERLPAPETRETLAVLEARVDRGGGAGEPAPRPRLRGASQRIADARGLRPSRASCRARCASSPPLVLARGADITFEHDGAPAPVRADPVLLREGLAQPRLERGSTMPRALGAARAIPPSRSRTRRGICAVSASRTTGRAFPERPSRRGRRAVQPARRRRARPRHRRARGAGASRAARTGGEPARGLAADILLPAAVDEAGAAAGEPGGGRGGDARRRLCWRSRRAGSGPRADHRRDIPPRPRAAGTLVADPTAPHPDPTPWPDRRGLPQSAIPRSPSPSST